MITARTVDQIANDRITLKALEKNLSALVSWGAEYRPGHQGLIDQTIRRLIQAIGDVRERLGMVPF
jgi:hypothetical protein